MCKRNSSHFRPANTQWLMVRYSDTVSVGKFVSGKAIGNQLDQLSNDGSTGDPALLEAIERALVALKSNRATHAK